MKTPLLYLLILTSLVAKAQPNCSAASTGFTPLNDLGTGISPATGLMGGLYPNGSNYIPAAHKNAGLQLANQVECLNANGQPDAANGRIVWLSIGMSNCTQETQQFIPQANAFAGKNPKLTLVDGAQGGQNASIISTASHPNYASFWNTVNTRLSNASVTANQVQVIWFKEANPAGTTPVQVYHDSLVDQFKRVMQEIKQRFPNVKLCYLSSRSSGRYASTTLNPEPYAYWQGWACKKVIEQQINGDAALAYSGPGAKSPWVAWGIYMWSDGSTPQTTNPAIFYTCPADLQNDGTHPSTTGAQKVGGFLLNFFSTDSTTTPWFLGTGCSTGTGMNENEGTNSININPNPSQGTISIQLPAISAGEYQLEIYDPLGKRAHTILLPMSGIYNLSALPNGIYLLKVYNGDTLFQQRLVLIH